MSEFKITERKIKILWIIVFIFIFLDFITTLIDVVILGYDELNPFIKNLLYEKDLIPVLYWSSFIVPLTFYGISCLSNSKEYKFYFLLILIIMYSSVLFNNFYLMIT
jgi:hypothetical protein